MAAVSLSNIIVQKQPKHKAHFNINENANVIDLVSENEDDVIVIEDESVTKPNLVAVPGPFNYDSLKPYGCHLCPKRFAHKSNLYTHRKVHDPLRETYPCNVCGRTFLYKCSLKVHMLTHMNQKQFQCKTCAEVLKNEALLKLHEAIKHMHPCDYCDETFLSKSTLAVHRRTHTNKISVCKVCLRIFKYRNHLLLHMRTHEMKPRKINVRKLKKTKNSLDDNGGCTNLKLQQVTATNLQIQNSAVLRNVSWPTIPLKLEVIPDVTLSTKILLKDACGCIQTEALIEKIQSQ